MTNPNPTNDALIESLIAANPDFAITLTRSRNAHAAAAAINALDDDDITDALRNIMTDDITDLMTMNPDHLSIDHTAFAYATNLLRDILLDIAHERDYDPDSRHALSDIALAYSLCPMHFCDYAICFDDDTDECATIRKYFPRHDT